MTASQRGAAQPLQDRGLEQERPHRLRLALQDLLAQVVEDEAVRSREGVQEDVGIRSVPEGERRQLQAHGPPLRPALEDTDHLGGEVEPPGVPQEGGRLLGGEAQVGGAQLTKPAGGAQPRERKRRGAAAGDH